jgi:hypothetical protein
VYQDTRVGPDEVNVRVMKKKLEGLDRFKGMSWSRAKRELDLNAHMLIFGKGNDPHAIRVVQAYRDFGLDVGMAVLASTLFVKRWGAATATLEAIRIYRAISKEVRAKPNVDKKMLKKLDTLDFELGQMEAWVYYASQNSRGDLEWPLKPGLEGINDRGGLANVLLYLCGLEFAEDGNTTSLIARMGIQHFMDRAIKAKEKK